MEFKYYGVRDKSDLSKSKVYPIGSINYQNEFKGASVKSKKFVSKDDAQKFVDIFLNYQNRFFTDGKVNRTKVEKFNKDVESEIKNISSDQAIAFTDGSYFENGKAGYGVAFFMKEGEKDISAAIDVSDIKDDDKYNPRNTYAEIRAVERAIKSAIQNHKKELTIYFDFDELDTWALGFDDTTIPMTQKYKDFYDQQLKTGLKVNWCEVPAHKGVNYNEKVDGLAKDGANKSAF